MRILGIQVRLGEVGIDLICDVCGDCAGLFIRKCIVGDALVEVI